MNIELRWVEREQIEQARLPSGRAVTFIGHRERVLQYREREERVSEGELVPHGYWSDWQDVPVEAASE